MKLSRRQVLLLIAAPALLYVATFLASLVIKPHTQHAPETQSTVGCHRIFK